MKVSQAVSVPWLMPIWTLPPLVRDLAARARSTLWMIWSGSAPMRAMTAVTTPPSCWIKDAQEMFLVHRGVVEFLGQILGLQDRFLGLLCKFICAHMGCSWERGA